MPTFYPHQRGQSSLVLLFCEVIRSLIFTAGILMISACAENSSANDCSDWKSSEVRMGKVADDIRAQNPRAPQNSEEFIYNIRTALLRGWFLSRDVYFDDELSWRILGGDQVSKAHDFENYGYDFCVNRYPVTIDLLSSDGGMPENKRLYVYGIGTQAIKYQ